MNRNSIYTLLFVLLLITSRCTQNSSRQPSQEFIQHFINRADSLTSESQKLLLGNLMQAIRDSGAVYAIAYCNKNAGALTNSFAEKNEFSIKRIAEKARNPENQLVEELDKSVWNEWKAGIPKGIKPGPITKMSDTNPIYYKPITIAMTTCLTCHGSERDLFPGVKEKITQLYPNDNAIGFELNELRGFWKVEKK